jgi:hypothetical protein
LAPFYQEWIGLCSQEKSPEKKNPEADEEKNSLIRTLP